MSEHMAEDGMFTHLMTLLLGGGGVGSAWLYATKRRETESERIARFEDRLLVEYHRTQDDYRAMNVEMNTIREAYNKEASARERATKDLLRAEEDLRGALDRVSTLEGELTGTRELVQVLQVQNGLLRRRLREHGDELGGESSEGGER